MKLLFEALYRGGWKRDMNWTRFLLRWGVIGLAFHLVAATSNLGFTHLHEQLDVMEFVQLKLSSTPMIDAPERFWKQSQTWFLPSIFVGLGRLVSRTGAQDPFAWSHAFRVLSGVVGWLATFGLALCSFFWIPNRRWRQAAVVLTTLLWVLPSFHATTSAWNWGGSLFWIGLCFGLLTGNPVRQDGDRLERLTRNRAVIVGVIWGMASMIYPPVTILVALTLLNWFVIWRMRFRALPPLGVGFGVVALVSILIDRWGYGQWTLAWVNYWRTQWYPIWQSPLPAQELFSPLLSWELPLTAFLAATWLLFWGRNLKRSLAWITLLYSIVALLLLRDRSMALAVLTSLSPMVIVMAFYRAQSNGPELDDWLSQNHLRWPIRTVIVLNTIALLLHVVLPASQSTPFLAKLYRLQPFGYEMAYRDENPWLVQGQTMNFYRPPQSAVEKIDGWETLLDRVEKSDRPLYYVQSSGVFEPTLEKLRSWCQQELRSAPAWIEKMQQWKVLPQWKTWTVFKCENPNRKLLSTQWTHSTDEHPEMLGGRKPASDEAKGAAGDTFTDPEWDEESPPTRTGSAPAPAAPTSDSNLPR